MAKLKETIKFVFPRVDNIERKENIEGKEENAGYQHFFLCSQCFLKFFFFFFFPRGGGGGGGGGGGVKSTIVQD